MIYHWTTLTIALGTANQVLPGVERWCAAAPGTLLGCWTADVGDLNRVHILQGLADHGASDAERRRALMSDDPFHAAGHITALSVDRMSAFPGVPPVQTGRMGPVYEIRSYTLRPGGLPTLLGRWSEMLPARNALSPILIAMHALDGAPRIVHVWPYPDLAARDRLRTEAVSRKIWPPPTAPQIAAMQSSIAFPTPFSPLQ